MNSVAGDYDYLELITNSKSGSFFFYSHDHKYIIKNMKVSQTWGGCREWICSSCLSPPPFQGASHGVGSSGWRRSLSWRLLSVWVVDGHARCLHVEHPRFLLDTPLNTTFLAM